MQLGSSKKASSSLTFKLRPMGGKNFNTKHSVMEKNELEPPRQNIQTPKTEQSLARKEKKSVARVLCMSGEWSEMKAWRGSQKPWN